MDVKKWNISSDIFSSNVHAIPTETLDDDLLDIIK
jgi:hypothetical protein